MALGIQLTVNKSPSDPFRFLPTDSEPSTLDSQSSTTLFLLLRGARPSTAALPSPPSCEPSAFSPGAGPPALPHLLPSLPTAPAPSAPGSGALGAAGLTVVASSPEAASRAWTGPRRGPSATPSRHPRMSETGRAPRRAPLAQLAGEGGRCDLGASPQPCAPGLLGSASLEANVGDILVELRTMNGHLTSSRGPSPNWPRPWGRSRRLPPDAPDAGRWGRLRLCIRALQ